MFPGWHRKLYGRRPIRPGLRCGARLLISVCFVCVRPRIFSGIGLPLDCWKRFQASEAVRFRCLWCSGRFFVRCSPTARAGMVWLPCRRVSVDMARRSARQALRCTSTAVYKHCGVLQGAGPHSDPLAHRDSPASRRGDVPSPQPVHFRGGWHHSEHAGHASQSGGLASISLSERGLRVPNHAACRLVRFGDRSMDRRGDRPVSQQRAKPLPQALVACQDR